MNPHNDSLSSPFNVNNAVNSSAPSNLSAGSAWDGSSTTSQGDVPAHSHDCVHNYGMSWSGLTPPQGLAPGHGPDYSSAWNNSPASFSNAFNVGYDMVSCCGGRTPNIGEAFIQGTLFAQHARPPFHVSVQSVPRPIAPTPAEPGHGCASCGHNLSFAARSGPSVPPSLSPGHPGASGLNMPGAPRQPAPNATVSPPPGFGTLGSPPVAKTTPRFPFMSPPLPSFPFNLEMAGATAGQAPSVAPSSVARHFRGRLVGIIPGDDHAHQQRTLGHVCLGPQVTVHRSLALRSLTLVVGLRINSCLQWPHRRARGLDSNVPLVQPPRPQILLLVFKQQLAHHLLGP